MKKRYIGFGAGTLLLIAAMSGGHAKQPTANLLPKSSNVQSTTAAAPTSNDTTVTPASPAPSANSTPDPKPINATPSSDGLSNGNTYTNVDGDTVHSPAYSENGSVPAGASARCVDGTYSFSENHRGTCSHHGGVAEWL